MIKKYSILLAMIGLFVLLTSINIYQWTRPSSGFPKAKDGVLNASGWRFASQGTILLGGEWEFYPDRLLGPEDFHPAGGAGLPADRKLVRIPDNWQSSHSAGDKHGYGAGTYRLTVRVDRPGMYSLRTKKVRMSSRIYMNGVEVGGSGQPSLTLDGFVSSNLPSLGTVKTQSDTVEIIIQAASFDTLSGGLGQLPEFGLAQDIVNRRSQARMADMALITIMLVFGLYYAGMFRQWRREPHLLWFCVFCIATGLYYSIDNEILLSTVWPSLSFNWLQRLLFLLPLASFFSFIWYIYKYLKEKDNRLFYWVRICAYVYFVMVLVMPSRYMMNLMWYFGFPLTLGAIFLMFYAVFRYRSRSRGGRRTHAGYYILLGIFFLITSWIYALMHYSLGLDNPYYMIVSPLLLVLSQALLMSEQLQDSYRQSDQLARRLLRYDRQKDEFLVKTSHELRTPLHGIVNLSQALLDNQDRPLPPEQRDNIRLLHLIGRRLAGLVNDILDLNRIRYGQLSIRQTPVNLAAAIRIVTETLAISPMKNGVRLISELPPALPLVLADENRLKQILYNLIENGLKYTEQGDVTVSAERRGSEIAVTVADTGGGIPEDVLAGLFQPFAQVQEEGDFNEGLGLGLSVSKQLIELHGGRLEVESEVGRGSRFTFTLPVDPASEETDVSIAEEASIDALFGVMQSERGAAFRILIVDDDPSNRKVLIDEVASMRYAYMAVGSGEEALEALRRGTKPDLVLLDLVMQGISGLEVCREIRKLHGLTELPVLMLTAPGSTEDMQASFAAGANDILQKPFELTELRARMQSLLSMKSSSERAVRREMDFLQARITPHFLYNSLNSLMALSYKDIEKLRETIHHLTTYLRGKFTFALEDEKVSFEREAELVSAYLAIEQLRFGSRLQVVWDIGEDVACMLPPLTIQPVVENAVRHGVGAKLSGGTVRISAHRADGGTWIAVEDDGVGMDEERLNALTEGRSGGVGVGNVNRRLQMLYGRRLDIRSSPGRGTQVKLFIPD